MLTCYIETIYFLTYKHFALYKLAITYTEAFLGLDLYHQKPFISNAKIQLTLNGMDSVSLTF